MDGMFFFNIQFCFHGTKIIILGTLHIKNDLLIYMLYVSN